MILRPELLRHPNIPKPLHGVNPRNVMGQKWWDRERKKAYVQNNDRCWACGVHKSQALYRKWLEAHEAVTIDYENAVVTLDEIVALCHACHNFIHNGRVVAMYKKGQFSLRYVMTIMNHGMNVLSDANLRPLPEQAYVYLILSGKTPQEAFDTLAEKDLLPTPRKKTRDWHEWKYIIEGEAHYSQFKDQQEWAEYYGK